MNVNLTPGLERLLTEKAEQNGLDVSAYLAVLLRDALGGVGGAGNDSGAGGLPRKPISERFDEIRRQAPEQVQQALRELPADFAAEHDQCIYSTPRKHS